MDEIYKLFSHAKLDLAGKVKWGEDLNEDREGIYIIALPENVNHAPIDRDKIESWKSIATNMTLDNHANPSTDKIIERLSSFWIPDTKILYIGQTKKSLNSRLRQFYRHTLGNRAPHAGGHWIKILKNIDKLDIYFSVSKDPKDKETDLLLNFTNAHRAFPFANLTCKGFGNKKHRIGNSRL